MKSESEQERSRKALIEALVPEDLRLVAAYHVQDSGGLLKLDAMENSFPLPEPVTVDFNRALQQIAVNRYPSPHSQEIESLVRSVYDVDAATSMIFGNGSDELIQLLVTVIARTRPVVLAPLPSFVMYGNLAALLGCSFHGVPLTPDFGLDMAAMRNAILEFRPALVFLAQPNNPTGKAYSAESVREMAAVSLQSGSVLVIDEAYEAFTDYSALGLEQTFENVLILRTLSKLGMAGARFGMLFGHPDWITELDKARLPYNVNVFTQAFITSALTHYHLFSAQTEAIRESRKVLVAALEALPWAQPCASEANFVLVRISGLDDVVRLHSSMRDMGVLVKCMHGSHPLVSDCLRLTVGQPAENERMLEVLKVAYERLIGERDNG